MKRRAVLSSAVLVAAVSCPRLGRAEEAAPQPAAPTAPAPAATAPPMGPPMTQPGPMPAPGVPPNWAPGYAVPVALNTDTPGLTVELYGRTQKPGRDAPVVRCITPCVVQVPPESYRVHVHETEDTLAGSRVVDLHGASYVTVTPDSSGQRWAGLGMGIGGIVAIAAGGVLLMVELSRSLDCIDTCNGDDINLAVPGLLLVLGGLVVTPIGWIMFGSSFRPSVDVQPAQLVQQPASKPRVLVGGGPRGTAGFGLGLAF